MSIFKKFKVGDLVIINGANDNYNLIICKVIENKNKFSLYPNLEIIKGNIYHKKGTIFYGIQPQLLTKLNGKGVN